MKIQPLTDSDRMPWAELLAQVFDRTPLQMLALLDWSQQHYELLAWGAWDGTQLAAQYAVLVQEVYDPIQKTFIKVGLSINMAVHQMYRGRGLIKQISVPVYEALQSRGAVAGVGFSNLEGVRVDRHSKGYGYRVVGQMRSVIGWLVASHADPLTLSDYWPTTRIHPPVDQSSRIQFRISPDKLYWRFACHPFRSYHYGVWQTANTVNGVVVYRPVTFKGITGAALLAAYTEYPAALPDLVARWCAAMRKVGAVFVHLLTSPISAVRMALKKSALCAPVFLSRSPYYLTVKPLGTMMPLPFLSFPAWDCLGGDIL